MHICVNEVWKTVLIASLYNTNVRKRLSDSFCMHEQQNIFSKFWILDEFYPTLYIMDDWKPAQTSWHIIVPHLQLSCSNTFKNNAMYVESSCINSVCYMLSIINEKYFFVCFPQSVHHKVSLFRRLRINFLKLANFGCKDFQCMDKNSEGILKNTLICVPDEWKSGRTWVRVNDRFCCIRLSWLVAAMSVVRHFI